MTNMELETDIEALDMEMGDITIHYCPVIPNPEGEPTAELKTADIEGTIYEIVDEEARTELENKVDKVEGKDLSTNDYTDEDKAIVDGVTTALDGKVDKDGDKVLSDNNYSDTDKAIVDGVTEALNGKADKSDTYTKLEVDSALDNKVDKVEGKNLSENDFTDTLKDKLDGIEAEANKTVVDNSVTATSTNPVESKAIYNLLNDLLPEATETGNPITISNASGLNAKSLKVELEPIQDLNGYDSPWVGGGGKNKLNPSTMEAGYITATGTIGNQGSVVKEFYSPEYLEVGTSTYISVGYFGYQTGEDKWIAINWYNSEKENLSRNTSNAEVYAFAVPENAVYFRVSMRTYNHGTEKCYSAKGNDTTFAPYSNICPISGRTQTTVKRTGLNVFDEDLEVGSIDTSGNNSSGADRLRSKNYVKVFSGLTYYFRSERTVNGAFFLRLYDKNKTYITNASVNVNNTYTIPSGVEYIRFTFVATTVGTYYNDICVNISNASVNGTYEPYTEADTTIQFGQTVYGGEVDVTSGGTSDEWGYIASYNGETLSGEWLSDRDKYVSGTTPTIGAEVVYKKTPTTINTPATTISLNKGNNTLSTSGDNMDLKYSKIPQ